MWQWKEIQKMLHEFCIDRFLDRLISWYDAFSFSSRRHLKGVGCSVLLAVGSFLWNESSALAKENKRPNIVFILADDLGWTDINCRDDQGNPTDGGEYDSTYYKTPNLADLRAKSMRFTNAYAACPRCVPTRASIVTGKYPARLHITGGSATVAKLRPATGRHLLHEEITIAEALKATDPCDPCYATAFIGKWHLSGDPCLPTWPENNGFDYVIGGRGSAGGTSHFAPYKMIGDSDPLTSKDPWEDPCGNPDSTGTYITDRIADNAIDFIEEAHKKDQPFFLYLSHYAVHATQGSSGLETKCDDYNYFSDPCDGNKHQNRAYAGMIKAIDDSVGRIMKVLDPCEANNPDGLGIADNTIIIFFSDNGGMVSTRRGYCYDPCTNQVEEINDFGLQQVTSNFPLSWGKSSFYEGGIRVPLIVYWPGVTDPCSTCDVPVCSIDFLPTILDMAGIDLGDAGLDPDKIDGESITDLLQNPDPCTTDFVRTDDALYWHHPHNSLGGPLSAIRKTTGQGNYHGDYKLIKKYDEDSYDPCMLDNNEWFSYYHPATYELYDLSDDIGETTNLADADPCYAAIVDELDEQLINWLIDQKADMAYPRVINLAKNKYWWIVLGVFVFGIILGNVVSSVCMRELTWRVAKVRLSDWRAYILTLPVHTLAVAVGWGALVLGSLILDVPPNTQALISASLVWVIFGTLLFGSRIKTAEKKSIGFTKGLLISIVASVMVVVILVLMTIVSLLLVSLLIGL